jgi:hypothetical protein
MRTKLLTLATFLLLSLSLSSCRKERDQVATLISGCAGNYLVIDGENYEVCNADMLEPFDTGTEVVVDYKVIKSCNDSSYEGAMCYVLIHFEALVEVLDITALEP